ncbi:MAG: hypothetical protein ACPIOQ_82210 [Promethearchaeia archaeon]
MPAANLPTLAQWPGSVSVSMLVKHDVVSAHTWALSGTSGGCLWFQDTCMLAQLVAFSAMLLL